MRCTDVEKRLSALTSGELPVDLRQGVLAHCAECADCRKALSRIDILAGVLSGLQEPPVPPGFASRALTAAQSGNGARPSSTWSPVAWWRSMSSPLRAAAALALIVGLTAGIALGRAVQPETAQPGPVAEDDPAAPYRLDYLGHAPAGSLPDRFLSLVASTDEGGR